MRAPQAIGFLIMVFLVFGVSGCSFDDALYDAVFDDNNDSSNDPDISDDSDSSDSGNLDQDSSILPASGPCDDPTLPYFIAMDIHWYGDGTFAVLYANINMGDTPYEAVLARLTVEGELLWVTNGGMFFPHTLFAIGDDFLISDSEKHRIIIIGEDHEIKLEIGQEEMGECFFPNDADLTEDGTIMLSNLCTNEILEINFDGEILWSYSAFSTGMDRVELHDPDLLENGNILYCDSGNNIVYEIDRSGHVVWSYNTHLMWPRNADRLENGNTLIVNSYNAIEVTPGGKVVWKTEDILDIAFNAERLDDGTTVIAAGGDRVIRVNKSGETIWSYSMFGPQGEPKNRAFMQPHRKYALQSLGYLQ